MKGCIARLDINCFIGCLFAWLTIPAYAINLEFKGELVDRPCQIDSGSLNQTVQFLERPVKDFQVSPGKGATEKFSIRLVDCDTSSLWKTVKLKFSGVKEQGMNENSDWFLSVTGDNKGKLAVGLLDTDGVTPLKLDTEHNNRQGTSIDKNTVILNFSAFVQATPEAIANKSVVPAEYTATAFFDVLYE
ncbi:type 1 fimbrial protein [Escherichia coli]|nr:type 1 fimbrial protein [Escherichia coli]